MLFVLPRNTPQPAPTLNGEQAWNFSNRSLGAGYYLFLEAGREFPANDASKVDAFADRIHDVLPRVVNNQHASLGWVTGDPNVPSSVQVKTLNFVRTGPPNSFDVVTAGQPQRIEFLRHELTIMPGTRFRRRDDDSGFDMENSPEMVPPGANPNDQQRNNKKIYLTGASGDTIDKLGDVVIPLSGNDRGGVKFSINRVNNADTVPGAMDTAIYYVVPEPTSGKDQSLRFPFVDLNGAGGPLGSASTIDLSATLYPTNPDSSTFVLNDETLSEQQVIRTFFRTERGEVVYLMPLPDAGFVFTEVPSPGAFPARGPNTPTYFTLTPVGHFELLLENPPSDPDEFSRLLGGQSGAEYISFRPRRNGTPGDVLSFYPGQFGYAPGFGAEGAALQQADLGLLTGKYRTSWVSVGYHPSVSPNGRRNQYYAQPDDNVLHTQVTNEFLESVEVAAADLPPLTHTPDDAVNSFPLTPLSGVTPPYERISPAIDMEDYVVFEKEIINPTRKNRISNVKLTSIATNQGRSLLQNGTVHAVTPQGMLVEVEGNDWRRLTLAFDGIQHLRFEDITDEFQDALQTNRLFMVASLPDTLAAEGDYTENKVEVTEWPFRLEVGLNPLGLPTGTGLHRYNNVLLFKFVDETFDDLADDIRLWANPDEFNGDPADVAEWLKEFIADARLKAVAPASKKLYEPLVKGVLDNPNWTGVLSLNVTIPLGEMPCEVKGLLGGIKDWSTFKAHHVGFEVSKVNPDGTSIERSSIFGLLDYQDPGTPTEGNPTYDFRVNKLQVRFANTEIANFDAEVVVTMNELFDEAVDPVNSTNKLTLKGTYEVLDGKPTYSFGSSTSVPFKLMGLSLIDTVTFTKCQFATGSCPVDLTQPVESRFSFWGSFTFRLNAAFDFFSFDKLEFADLSLKMSYLFDNDGIPEMPATFAFAPGDVRFNVAASRTRQDSLLGNFPLRLKGFHYAGDGLDVKKMGYLDIPGLIPGWSGATKPRYGLDFTLDLGPLASSSSKKLPTGAIDVIAAWEPSGEGGGVTFGVAIGRNKDGKMEIGIEGVFVLSIQGFGFQKLPAPAGQEGHVYAFFLKSAFIKVMSMQVPPGGSVSLVLFVPYVGGTKPNASNLGWFVAYKQGTGSSGASPAAPSQFDVEITETSLSASEVEPNSLTPVTISVKVRNKNTPPKEPEEITVSVKAIAVDPTDTRPLPPTPPSQKVTVASSQTSDAITFSWPPKVAGKYKFTATAMIKGDLNPGDNTRDSAVLTVKENPGKKDEKRSIVQLDYLGLGHRVKFPGSVASLTSVEAVLKEMDAKIVPNAPAPVNSDPTASNAALTKILGDIYSPDGGWLIGLDVTLFEVVRIAIVFAQDNNMYGALLGFAKKAPSFIRGFQIQVLYKKITDEIGVYHILIKLPDSLRQFNIGAAAITLPTIGVDIYTNGDFKLDLGFPYNADFTKSFGIQAMAGPIPIIGYAGFYFAKLSGPTSSKAPKLKPFDPNVLGSGKFDPVLEFGLGLSLGIGKTFEKGPLRAGVSVSIIVILEGAVGYYQEAGATSAESSAPVFTQAPDWYLVKGQAGLQAILFGVVDFGIIKAGIEVTATALFTFTVESYKDIVMGLSLSVSVKVTVVIGSIKIFGKRITIKVSFSFSATFSFSFTIKNPQVGQEPWRHNLATPTSAAIGSRALMQVNGPATAISWNTEAEVFAPKRALELTFSPQVTIAGEPSTPRVVAGLSILHGQDDLGGFDPLAEGLLRWAVYSGVDTPAGDDTPLTLDTLLHIEERLNVPVQLSRQSDAETPLNYSTIKTFLENNFTITVKPPATYEGEDAPESAATIFPMIPDLQMSITGNESGDSVIDFSTWELRDDAYQDGIREYFDSLLVDVEHKSKIFAQSSRMLQQAGTELSMATIVFQDYFAFLVKTGIDRAAQYVNDNVGTEDSMTLGDLIAGMRTDGDFRRISSMTSRFFLHGLRLPPAVTGNHVSDSATAVALYELTGQQVAVSLVPLPDPPDPDDEDAPPPEDPVDWELELLVGNAGSFLTSDGELKLVIDRDDVESTNAFNAVDGAQISLGAITVDRLPSIADQPKRFTFKNPTPLELGPIATPTSSGLLYPLPETLLDIFRSSGAPADLTPFNEGDGVSDPAIFTKRPALRVNFTVKRVPRAVDGATDLLPNVYQIGGMSEGTRALVGRLIAHLENSGTGLINDLRMYYEVFGKSDAIVQDNLGSDPDVVLMKTNLSTVSAPQDGATLLSHHPSADDFSAAMIAGQLSEFLRLLWEASIVNAPGYYLYYDNGTGGDDTGLPEDIFGGMSNEGHVSLVVTFTSFNSFANSYLIDGPNFEEGTFYLESQSLRKWAPALAPGALAFELTRPNPQHGDFEGASGGLGLETLFNLLSYQVVGNDDFNASIRGLPVGPTDPDADPDIDPETLPEPATWTYRQGIRVYPFAANSSLVSTPGNTYNGVGGAMTLSFDFLDVYGNTVTPVDAGSVPKLANQPIRYYDPIIGVGQWPSVSTSYVFNPNGESGDLLVTLAFDTSDYIMSEDADRVTSATEGFLRIYEQLNGPGVSAGLRTSIAPDRGTADTKAAMVGFVDDVLAFLNNVNPAEPSIERIISMSSITEADRDVVENNIFPVTVEVVIERQETLVDADALVNLPEARRSATTISPQSVAGGGNEQSPTDQPMALETFTEDFEDAFPEFKVATGLGESGPNTIWAVRLGTVTSGGNGLTYQIDGSAPSFFTPAPLSKVLLARDDVSIFAADGQNNPTAENFANIDMDKWGREFLEEVDRFLTADIAVTARKVNAGAYERIVSAKAELADGISEGITNVLEPAPENGTYEASAREAYRQALLTRLLSAYEVETAVVYPVGTTNTFDATIAPRLFGNIKGDPKLHDGAEFSFSSAKVELSGGSDAKFAFLFSADRTEDQASALVDITYRITHVEHDIQTAQNGYEASSWLTLVQPIVNTTFTDVDIPIALREYPTPPSLVGQEATPQYADGATTLESATLWEYLYTYEQRAVAQDTIFTNVKFNVGPEISSLSLQQSSPDLFDWLARFSREYPVLKENLDLVLVGFNEMSGPDRTAASSAIDWFADLVAGVAGTWGAWVNQQNALRQLQQSTLGEYEWDFDLTERLFGNESIIEMRVTADSHPSAHDNFPRIQLLGEDGEPQVLTATISDGIATYSHPWSGGELPEFLERTQIFDDLDVLHTENAWGGIHLERNLNLSAPGATRTTNPRFIYQTPEVRFVNKVTPYIDNKQPIDISEGQMRSLTGHLGAVLGELFESAVDEESPRHRLVKVGVRYAYDVRGQQGPAIGPGQTDEFQAYLAVTQVMPFELVPNDMSGFINGLAGAMSDWLDAVDPSRSRAFYEFDISVFAALSNTDLPVLRLRRLWLGLDMIS